MSRALLTVITDEAGAEKTTLIQALLGDIEENVTVGLISNVQGGRGALLRWVLNAFDKPALQDADYVTHRLQHTCGAAREFTAEALRYIHDKTDGISRMVNNLCDLALVYTVSAKQKRIELVTIKEITRDALIFRSVHSILILSNPIINRGKAAE